MKKYWLIGFALCVLIAGLTAYGAGLLIIQSEKPDQEVIKPEFSAMEIAAIAPHKALYKIEMVQKSSSAQVLNISGQMYFEWKPVCDAWSTNHRFDLLYDYADSPQMRISSAFTTYESIAGDSFDFNSSRRRNNEIYEELRGHATIMPAHEGQAVFTLPADLKFDLPKGTLFPMAQTLAVLKAAREGKKFLKVTIFDGSDDEGPVEVNTFIGAPVNGLSGVTPSAAINPALLKGPARKVRLAFFPLNNTDPDSDYEMNMVLQDNGVISDMRVDYKDFSVTQKLIGLEPIKAESCFAQRAEKAQ